MNFGRNQQKQFYGSMQASCREKAQVADLGRSMQMLHALRVLRGSDCGISSISAENLLHANKSAIIRQVNDLA